MKRYVLLAIVLGPLLIAALFLQNSGRESYDNMYEALGAEQLLVHDYDQLLEGSLELLFSRSNGEYISNSFEVNKEYVDESYSFYVVDDVHCSLKLTGFWEYVRKDSFCEAIANNVIAAPPNVVIFSSSYLKRLVFHAAHEQVSINRLIEEINALRARFGPMDCGQDSDCEPLSYNQEIDPTHAIHEFQRRAQIYGMTQFFRRYKALDEELESGSSVDRFVDPLLEREPDGPFIEFFSMMIAPVMFHELAHLETYESGFFFSNEHRLADWYANQILEEETRADELALSILTALLEKFDTGDESDEGLDAFNAYIFRAQPVVSIGHYFRDSLLNTIFEGFRGLKAEEHFFKTIRRSCAALEPPGSDAILAVDTNVLSLALQDAPLFSRSDLDNLRERAGWVVGSTHPHPFDRSLKFLDGIDRQADVEIAVSTKDVYPLVELLRSCEPPISAGSVQDVSQGFFLDVVDEFSDEFAFDHAINCELEQCLVGNRIGKSGFLETRGEAPVHSSIRLKIPVADDDDYQLIKKFLGLLNFDPAATNRITLEIRRDLEQCGHYSQLINIGNAYMFTVWSVNSRWVSMDMFRPGERANEFDDVMFLGGNLIVPYENVAAE